MKAITLLFKGIKKDKISQSGQATVEMVLITALLVGTCVFVLNKFQEYYRDDPSKNPIYQFISGPWKATAGMIEAGVWEKRETAKSNHSNRAKRAYSAKGQTL